MTAATQPPSTQGAPAPATTPETMWYRQPASDALTQLASHPEAGLTAAEAASRLAKYGPNELIDRGGRTVWEILWEQVSSVVILILIGAAVLAAVLGKPVDAIAIGAIVVIFVVLGIVQEHKAQKAIAALKQMAAPVVKAVRDGRTVEVSARELVPGDIVRIETGSVVPADVRILESINLRVQEAALTGESEPVEKITEALDRPDLTIGDRRNMGYYGTFATYGRGLALVVGTGMQTELGRIASMIQNVQNSPTPLQRRLDKLGKALAIIAVVIGGLVVVSGMLRGEEFSELLLTGVSIAVAIVPEGLPAVLTFTLALGAQRMLKRKALIRKLPAVETLGSVTVICSDKTGTLTQNRMTVTVLETPDRRHEMTAEQRDLSIGGDDASLAILLAASALCNDATLEKAPDAAGRPVSVGDPTEAAMVVAAARYGLSKDDLERAFERRAEVPFDSDRKLMTTIHAPGGTAGLHAGLADWFRLVGDAPYLGVTKGAADNILSLCNRVFEGGTVRALDNDTRQRLQAANDAMTRQGIRVLGVAFRGIEALGSAAPDARDVERDLVFAGLVGMIDPPRPEARDAVAICKRAGIRPVMITGDHPLTARFIAADLGMTSHDSVVVTGAELEKMTAEDLQGIVDEVNVFARVSPEHKLKIVEALQKRGHVVAMTGDGVNDAPALKKADIGVAMGTGTDVAKEAADMVLVDDNFATIVAAVEEGRIVYDNLRRFIMFSVAGNVGKVLAVAVPPAIFTHIPTLLKPVQILWLNLLTDGLLGLGMGVEKGERDVMSRPPVAPGESVFARGVGAHIAFCGILIGVLTVGVALYYHSYLGISDLSGEAKTAAMVYWGTVIFTAIAFMQLAQAVASRSFNESCFTMNPFSNRVLFWMMLCVVGLQAFAIYFPGIQGFMHTASLSTKDILIGIGLFVVILVAMEFSKIFHRRAARAAAPR